MRGVRGSRGESVISLRGGYGCSRLIPLITKGESAALQDIHGIQRFDTLHLYFRRRFGWITFHGPSAASPVLANLGPDQEKHLLSL